jgi:hypothetical protein
MRYLIKTGAGYRLPFITTLLDQAVVNHRHTNPDGSQWVEKQTQQIRYPDMLRSAIQPACNDNEMVHEPV